MDIESGIQQAVALLQAGRIRQAGEICQQITTAYPEYSPAQRLAGLIALSEKDLATAEQRVQKAVRTARNGAESAQANYALGQVYTAQNAPDKAIDAYRQALASQPQVAEGYVSLGGAYMAAGRLKEAVTSYREALALQPESVSALNDLGRALLDSGQTEEAMTTYHRLLTVRHALGPPVPKAPPPDIPWMFTATSGTKLKHDIEQMGYLIEHGRISERYVPTMELYQSLMSEIPSELEDNAPVQLTADWIARLEPTYNRLIYFAETAAETVDGGAVNPKLDVAAIEQDYERNAPGITYFDDFLTPEALARLRQFCVESTIWFRFGYTGGNVGALMHHGFASPLLAQIARELREALPGIFGGHDLGQLWAYKYDSELEGIGMHADYAAVNVNFWITPDEANLDPETGGLTLYDKEAPLDWDFTKFNTDQDAIDAFLRESNARPVYVPYRRNRVMIFNSDLFHQTGSLRFKERYEDRRINITMLFGSRHSQ